MAYICQGTSYLEEDGKWRRCRLLIEQYEKRVMELHKVELLTAEGTKEPELKCDCSGFWEHTVCSHIWAVKVGVLTEVRSELHVVLRH